MSPAAPQRKPSAAGPAVRGRAHQPEPDRRFDEERPRHLHLVERQRRRPVHLRRLGVALLMVGLASLCLVLVALHALIAENQFTLNRLQGQAASAQATYQKLRLQVAELEAPERIVSVAEGKLKMVQPGSVTYLPAPKTSSAATSAATTVPPGPPRTGAQSTSSSRTVPAPQGDANWPSVKPYVSSSP